MRTVSHATVSVVLVWTLVIGVSGQLGPFGTTPATPAVKFNDTDFQNPRAPAQAAVFTAPNIIVGTPTTRVFQWTSQVDVSDVYLYMDGISTSIGHKSLAKTTSLGGEQQDARMQVSSVQLNRPVAPPGDTAMPPVDISAQSIFQAMPGSRPQRIGSISITNMGQLAQDMYLGKQLFFQLVWNNGTAEATYSRYFTVTTAQPGEPAFDVLAAMDVFRSEGKGLIPARPEGPPIISSDTTMPDSAQPKASSSVPGSSSTTTGIGSPGVDSTAVAAPMGPSTGAIIGIVVGAAIGGLVLIGGVAGFCFRRRRRNSPRRDAVSADGFVPSMPFSSFNDRRANSQILLEKEAGAAANVTQSSPFIDEATSAVLYPQNEQPEHQLRASFHGSPAGPSTASYLHEDTEREEQSRLNHIGSPVPVSASAQAVRPAAQPESYHHHLVEDGMTEDEIRRLVEEERELDHAIEQAGR